MQRQLRETATALTRSGHGILAADEPPWLYESRFSPHGIANTAENRIAFRDVLFSTPGFPGSISGVILHPETFAQRSASTAGSPRFVDILAGMNVLVGITVDAWLAPIPGGRGEEYTSGLDGLAERAERYRAEGASFAKWRSVFCIGAGTPSRAAVSANSAANALYASICQSKGLVPIVEPEVLFEGAFDRDGNGVAEHVLVSYFAALSDFGVLLDGIVLKTGFVTPGPRCPKKATPEQVAAATIEVFRRAVPAAVPGVMFLSGGLGEEDSTAYLAAVNAAAGWNRPWALSFSYGRALQDSSRAAWKGRAENAAAAREAFRKRFVANSAASLPPQSPFRNLLRSTLETQRGIVFAQPSIVHRVMYRGRNVVQRNSDASCTDSRGYFPVERWIMSAVHAGNDKPIEGEGISRLLIAGGSVLLTDALAEAERELLGDYRSRWPLTKVLDIGGEPVTPSFGGCKEVPGIPCHIHSGTVVRGPDGKARLTGPGKLEAYFFPPLDVPPHNLRGISAVTRLGIRPGVTKQQLVTALDRFGKDDSCYQLLGSYDVQPFDCWTLPDRVIHAPGPWVTFEIQRPQDDFNLASWTLGARIPEEHLPAMAGDLQMRGLSTHQEWVDLLLDWDLSSDPEFEKKWKRRPEVVEEGEFGRKMRIFFGSFNGQSITVSPGHQAVIPSSDMPCAGICWSGSGQINGNELSAEKPLCSEFLAVPGTRVVIKNTGNVTLLVFTVFPMTTL